MTECPLKFGLQKIKELTRIPSAQASAHTCRPCRHLAPPLPPAHAPAAVWGALPPACGGAHAGTAMRRPLRTLVPPCRWARARRPSAPLAMALGIRHPSRAGGRPATHARPRAREYRRATPHLCAAMLRRAGASVLPTAPRALAPTTTPAMLRAALPPAHGSATPHRAPLRTTKACRPTPLCSCAPAAVLIIILVLCGREVRLADACAISCTPKRHCMAICLGNVFLKVF